MREVIVYDKRGSDRGIGGMARLAGALRDRRYDAAFLAQGSVRSGALVLAAGIPERIGFSTSAGRAFYTKRVVVARRRAPRVRDSSRSAVAARRPTTPDARIRGRASSPATTNGAAVDALLRGVAPGEPLIALAPGSVWATKRWPYYADLARLLGR